MTLKFCDSFDSTTTIAQKWDSSTASGGSMSYNTGRFGNGLRFTQSGAGAGSFTVLKSFSAIAAGTTCIIGFAFQFTDSSPSTSNAILELNEDLTLHIDLRLTTARKLQVTRNGTQLGLGTTVLSASTWYYLELKVKIDDTTGTVDLKIDGVSELALTGQDTRNGGTGAINNFDLTGTVGASTSAVRNFDDLYLCDGSGSTNNDFLGDVRVEAINPNGNGNSSQMTGSDGNSTDNYQLVDENPPATADYVEETTIGEKDTYAFGNLTASTGTVYGVQTFLYAAKTDAGVRSLCPVARLSGTESDGSTHPLSTTARGFLDIYETKPGGGAWSISDVNSAEFGAKLVA